MLHCTASLQFTAVVVIGGVEDDADDDDHCDVVRANCLLHKCSCPSSNQPVNVDFDRKVGF